MKKRFLNILTMVVLSMAMVFVASCSKDSDINEPIPTPSPTPTPTPTPTPKDTTAKYTVIFYGCGGGNIDKDLLRNLQQIKEAGKKDSVNFVGLVKHSDSYQPEEKYAGVRYMTMIKDSLTSVKKYEASYRMDDPANLTKFITDSKKEMPAKHYILVLWNHGSFFGDEEKPVQDSYPEKTKSRAVLYQDSTALSTYEIEKAIKDSETKFDLVYFDCCEMGMVETYYQLKDCARYIMASVNEVPYLAGDYTRLMNDLQDKSTLEDAIKDFVPGTVNRWHEDSGVSAKDSLDLGCFDTSYLDELKEKVKAAATYLDGAITSDEAKLDEMGDMVSRDSFFVIKTGHVCVDMVSSFKRLAEMTNDETLAGYAAAIESVIEKMTVARKAYVGHEWLGSKISIGITWPTFGFWDYYSVKSPAYWADYRTAIDNSAFIKDAGWGTFLNDVTINFHLVDN